MEQKKIFFIQALHALIVGTVAIVLPLLMRERKVGLISIGLIYASLPLIFQAARMIFALISDFFGRKIFFILNGILKTVSLFVYCFAFSPLAFFGGRIADALSNASLWSVNRAFILEREDKKRDSLVRLRSFSTIFSAGGRLMAGFLAIYFLFENILIFCTILSFSIFLIALTIEERKFQSKMLFKFFDFKRKHPLFKKGLFLFLLSGLSVGFTGGYIFPLFLKSLGFETKSIGILLGFQMLLMGLFAFFLEKIKREKWLWFGILYSAILFLIGYFKNVFLISVLVLFLGLISAILTVFQEDLFSKLARDETYATDIGLLTAAVHLGRTISLAFSGFLIEFYGFYSVFFLAGSIFIIFSLCFSKFFVK